MGRLDGKVALISGTARGMGRAAAIEFAARGAAVFGCDLDEAASDETVALVTKAGGSMAAKERSCWVSSDFLGADLVFGSNGRKFGGTPIG